MLVAMLCALVTSVLLGVAARAGEQVLRGTRWPMRWLWVGALLGSVGLPALAWLTGGAWPGGLLPGGGALRIESLELGTLSAGGSTGAGDASAELRPGGWQAWLLAAWLSASLVAALAYGVAWARLAHRRRLWGRGQLEGRSVAVSASDGPLVMGLRRPTIVVPSWLLGEAPESQRMVLLHEAEHVRAGDHALLALAPVLAIVMPWNAPLWWQLARLRLAVELDCDRRVLMRGVEAAAYGAVLLDVAGRARARFAAAPALAEPRTFLERRILAMTERTRARDRRRGICFAALATVAMVLACETAGPVSVNDVAPPSTVLREAAERAGSAVEPVVVVDGVIREKATLQTMAAATIDRVEVVKGAAAVLSPAEQAQAGTKDTGAGIIRITTKAASPAETSASPPSGTAVRRVEVVPLTAADAESGSVTVRPSRAVDSYDGAVLQRSPAVEIDGRPGTMQILRELNPAEIANIEIIRPPLSARLFGDHARDGLIRVRTKQPR